MKNLSSNTRIAIIFTIAMVVVIAVFVTVALVQAAQSRQDAAAEVERGQITVLRDDTHLLDDVPDSKVTVVEFLDFECESCAAAYPMVEQAREDFAGEVTFGLRYFPIPSHFNSMNAAIAVEAAAQQGALEPMYTRMFETQGEWGEQQETRAPLFRQYAESLGLDMAQYDADVADPATEARVQSDFDDGKALGVSGTPTFFVNDKPLELTSFDDLGKAIEQELSR